jgi:hypothetical protein
MGGYQGFRRLQPGDPDSAAVQFGARARERAREVSAVVTPLAYPTPLTEQRCARRAVGGVVATLTQSLVMVPLEARARHTHAHTHHTLS